MTDRIFAESLRRTEARLRRELCLGRGAHSGRLYYLAPHDYLATHTHLVGASNFGKSYYIEHLLRGYTDLQIPASVIDPHGDLAEHYYQFLCRTPRLMRERKIVHFKPGSAANGLGFNPFQCGLADPAEVASLVLESFMKVWGEHTFNETPRLERVLRSMFHVFAANGLPLTECHQFLLTQNRSFRQSLLARVEDEQVRAGWEELERLPLAEKLIRFESSVNRLQRFIAIPAVANLFAANGNSLNFTDTFTRGDILVADLSRLRSTEAQSLVGTMVVNALYHAAKRRPEGRRAHWFLAIDEFPQFVTADIARSLDQLRKFGIRLILAHQRLSQLPEDLLGAVMTNAKNKVVFGGLSRPDAEVLARELFAGDVTGNQIKHKTFQTKFRPILTQMETETFSDSTTEGESESGGWSHTTSRSRSETKGETESDAESVRELEGETDETVTHALGSSRAETISSGESSGRSGSRGRSRAGTRGRSQSTAFVTDHEEFIEETGRQFRSLDEEWEVLIARIMRLDHREALIKVFNRPVLDIVTPEIRQLPARRPHKKALAKPARNEGSKPETAPKLLFRGPEGDLPEDFRE